MDEVKSGTKRSLSFMKICVSEKKVIPFFENRENHFTGKVNLFTTELEKMKQEYSKKHFQ